MDLEAKPVRVARSLGLVVVATVVALATLELLSVLYVAATDTWLSKPSSTYPERVDRAERPDERLGWSLKPGFSHDGIQINSQGLRASVDDLVEFCQGKETVLVVGDSMVYGYRIDQDKIFSEILNSKENMKHCYVNTGVVGYSTAQQLLALPDHIDRFDPDKILWFFTSANDVWGNARGGYFNPYYAIVDGELEHFPPEMEIDVSFYERTTTYRLMNRLLLGGRDLTFALQRLDFMIRGENSYVWRVTERLLEKVADVVRSSGIPLILLDVPSLGSLRRGEAEAVEAAVAKEVSFSLGDRYGLLEGVARRLEFEYVRTWEYYPVDFRSVLLPHDAHWNEEGHELVAAMILKLLEGEGSGEDRVTLHAPR